MLGLLGKRFTLNSLKFCGCKSRVAVAILLPSDKNLTENGVNPQRLEPREVQEARIRQPHLHSRPNAAWSHFTPWLFQLHEGTNLIFAYVKIFTTESILNEIVSFILQLSLKSSSFICSVQNHSSFIPAQMLPHPINKLCFPKVKELSPFFEFPEHLICRS